MSVMYASIKAMSNSYNDEILERANELMEETTGTWMEKAIKSAVDRDDLEELRKLISRIEHDLAVEHMHNTEQVKEYGDTY